MRDKFIRDMDSPEHSYAFSWLESFVFLFKFPFIFLMV